MGLRSEIVGDRLFFSDGENLFQPELGFFVVLVGYACNFKCRDCSIFAPYMPQKLYRYNVNKIIDNIKSMLKALSRVGTIQIQGGEPFMYPDLDRLVEFIGTCDNVDSQMIATNGTILPSDKLMDILKANNARIRISNYGMHPDKVAALEEKCERFGVQHEMYDFATGEAKWYETGVIDNIMVPPSSRTPESVERMFNECKFRVCLTLNDGEIGHCARSTRAHLVQKFERVPGDFVKVEDSLRFQMEFLKYVLAPHGMTACRYCNGTTESKMITPAVQLEKNIKG